tara:strand:+ start:1794 stop:3776 length:1983 start_codon:yes stop_codon:yes gene_type:complete
MLGALGKKLATGMAKGGAKKIAADKLLNRKKKPAARKPTLDELIADVRGSGEPAKGGALVVRPSASLVPSPGGDVQKFTGREGEYGSVEDNVIRIKSKVIAVDGILKGTLAAEKARKERQRRAQEQADAAAAESNLEGKKKKKKGPDLKKFVPKVAMNAFKKLVNFFQTIVLGYVTIQLLPLLPGLLKFVQGLSSFIGFMADLGLGLLTGLTTLIDWGYKLYDMGMGALKNAVGEEGAKKIESFMGVLKDLVNGFLVWKIIGQKILTSVVKTITRAFRIAKVILKKSIRFARRFLKNAGGFVKNVGSKALKVGGKVLNVGKNVLSAGKNVLAKGASKVGGFATKILGKAANVIAPALKTALPAVKGFARRIPILGPIIVGLVSAMTGDPVGQALFKAGGAALGGALGTFIPIPVLGTLIGETIGVYVGDVLYELLMGGGMAAAGQKLKDDFGKLLSGGEKVFGWLKDGFGRFMEGLPKGVLGLGKWFLFGNIVDKVKLIGKAFFSRDPMTGEKEEEDIEDTKKGAVDGKEPPLPKTDRGEKLESSSSMTYSSTTGVSTYKVEGEEVSKEEFDKYRSLSKEEKRKYVTPMRGDANNILATNNNIRDGVARSASYEEGAEETVLIQEPDTKSNSNQTEMGETKTLVVNTGATEDAYESLYMR